MDRFNFKLVLIINLLFMRTLTRWAGRHRPAAILLIILIEVVNAFGGSLLGAALLATWAVPVLCLLAVLLMSAMAGVYLYRPGHRDRPARHYLFVAFLGNYLLFGLLGGLHEHQARTAPSGVRALGNVASRSDGQPSVFSASMPSDSVRPTRTQASLNQHATEDTGPDGLRLLFFLLFFVGAGLTFLATAIACNIACAGYGFLAVLVFYLGLAGLGGGIYFLARALRRTVKRTRDMTNDERRLEGRRFLRTWLGVGIFFTLYALLGALTG